MGFLDRMFGRGQPAQTAGQPPPGRDIPPERVGLNGEYDESGLAKRVALAFDQDPRVSDKGHVWIAQTSTTIVLKGKVLNQEELNNLIDIASNVNGATYVDTSQLQIG